MKGDVLLERFYVGAEGRDVFLSALLEQTRKDWEEASVQRVAAVAAGVVSVFFRLGDLVFVLSGVEDYDELVVAETLRALAELVAAQCENLNENEFLAQHDRFSLMFDTVIRHGMLEHTSGPALSVLLNGAPCEALNMQSIQQHKELEVCFVCFFFFFFFFISTFFTWQRVSVPSCVLPKLEPKASAKQPGKNAKAPVPQPRPVSSIVVKQPAK